MLNRDIYVINPAVRKIVNEGVASVNDQNMNVLRYEIETFVCGGQYEKGIEHILDVYLRNLRQEQQPAVWISGFFGSGKSHLVKMLSAFWDDVEFADGARARELANLPENIKTHLHELNTQAKRYGGLHTAAGTLGSGESGSVRLALLRIIFKSTGLPEHYHNATFVMWLKSEHIFDGVKQLVEAKGYNWDEELDNMYVAEGLHEALSEVKPKLFPTPFSCLETLNNSFPNKLDVTSDEMFKAVRDALSNDGHIPLTLVVLDEVEQYIGEDSKRAMDVQEAVEACCKQIGSRLLFIGTGQTAVTGTALLKKLEGRFTVRIELSDTDVDAVVRKVVLAKKPDAIDEIKKIMEKNIGEISRHLSTTSIGHSQNDIKYFTQDYPILPVRRRFWECTFRVLDKTGTDSQLRNQLSMVHKAAQSNLSLELGNVIPADYLYFDLADKMLHARVLPRKVHQNTMMWIKQEEDDQIKARACGLVFLINQISGSNQEIGIRATADVLADLMITDLSAGSSYLRGKLPALLDNCELLMKVKDEYKIQTEESMSWLDEYGKQKSLLQNDAHRIPAEREDRIRKKFAETVEKVSLSQGQAKVSRAIFPNFDAALPADATENIYVWIRNGWNVEEETVRVDAKQAGQHSPTVYVFVPKRSEIRHSLIEYKAAMATLEKKGSPAPTTPEGKEAMAAMETIRIHSERNIDSLLSEAFSGAKVFQAGGNEIVDTTLKAAVISALNNSLQRLYTEFDTADNPNWGKVYAKAKEGAPDALKAIGFNGEASENPVCKTIMTYVAGGKKGADIRKNFEGSPYGWPGDAVDGALQTLLVSGQLRCVDEQGKNIDPKELERKQIGKASFKIESITVSAMQRVQIRKLFQKLGVKTEPGKESLKVSEFVELMTELVEKAGGAAPRPNKPETGLIDEINTKTGNDQLLFIYENRDQLTTFFDDWTELRDKIEIRIVKWNELLQLLRHAGDEKTIGQIRMQVKAIEDGRLLLHEPDMIDPLMKSLEGELRNLFSKKYKEYKMTFDTLYTKLESAEAWQKITEEKKQEILHSCDITLVNQCSVGSYSELLLALKQYPLETWNDRRAALKPKFDSALELANKEIEPELQTMDVPKRTFKSIDDIDVWLNDVEKHLKEAIVKGPIVIR